MKKLTGIVLAIIILFIGGLNGRTAAAETKQSSCTKTSFQIQLKAGADLKEKPDAKAKTVKRLSNNQKLGALERKGGWYKVCHAGKPAYLAASHAKELYGSQESMVLAKFKKRTSVKQILAVTGNKAKDTKVMIKGYEYIYGEWRRALTPMPGVIGYNGFAESKREGDGKSPMGIYSFGTAFGTAAKPSGMNWPYKRATKYDYWIDDPASKDYNKWITYTGNPSKRWKSYERMTHKLYKYGAVINYNTNPIVKGKGSAVFLHVWRGPDSKTAGCAATDEKHVIAILKWLNPKSNPNILISTNDYLKKMK
jgi:L,D-peptidoglycan transpeptidase YkuD (ErfK/YbiS/YcfS/YnhG family)